MSTVKHSTEWKRKLEIQILSTKKLKYASIKYTVQSLKINSMIYLGKGRARMAAGAPAHS